MAVEISSALGKWLGLTSYFYFQVVVLSSNIKQQLKVRPGHLVLERARLFEMLELALSLRETWLNPHTPAVM